MKKVILYLLIFLITITTKVYSIDTNTIYSKTINSIVSLKIKNYNNEYFIRTGFFALDSNIIVTNYNFVEDAKSIIAKDYKGNEYKIEGIVDYIESKDIALLKSNKKGATLAFDTNLPCPGTIVYCFDYIGSGFSLKKGMVSQIQKLDGINVIQFTSNTSSNYSGSPLFGEDGKIIGIVSSKLNKEQTKLDYAVPGAMFYSLNRNKIPIFESKNKKYFDSIMKDMVKCPAGKFMMGSPQNELGRESGNETQHIEIIAKPFYIGKYEVTQSLYEKIKGTNPSWFKGKNNPVENVDRDDAKDFCKKLNLQLKDYLPKGYLFDLPTEVQWEYACRAGTTTTLNSGKNITTRVGYCPNLDEIAWYEGNANRRTHPVGLKKPNAWGIYDMHGNVPEICKDIGYIFDDYDYKYKSSIIRGGGCCILFNNNMTSGQVHSSYTANTDCCSASSSIFDYTCKLEAPPGFRLALVPIEKGKVSAESGVNIREEPSSNSQKIGSLGFDTKITVLDTNGPKQTIENITSKWYLVTNGEITGWCFGGFINLYDEDE